MAEKINILMESSTRELSDAVRKLKRKTSLAIGEITMETSRFFLQAMIPKIKMSPKKREILKYQSEQEYKTKNGKLKKRKRSVYIVRVESRTNKLYKTKSGRKGEHIFRKRSDAVKLKTIVGRGMLRAPWVAIAKIIGGVSDKRESELGVLSRAKMSEVYALEKNNQLEKSEIIMTAKAYNSDSWVVKFAVAAGQFKASNRVNYLARTLQKAYR